MRALNDAELVNVTGGRLNRQRTVDAMRLGREHAEANGRNGFIGEMAAGFGDLGRQFLRIGPWTPPQQ